MPEEIITQPTGSSAAEPRIHTIPMEFYGGKNPAPAEIPQAATPGNQPVMQPKIAPKPVAVVATGPAAARPPGAFTQPTQKSGAPIALIVIIVVLVLGGGAGAAWFFLRAPKPAVQPAIPAAPVIPIVQEPAPVIQEPTTSTPATTTPEVVPQVPTTPTSSPALAILPDHQSYKDSVDGDNDGVTDVEEELWGSNGGIKDSDGDGYSDETELYNLYDPAQAAPSKLIESKYSAVYINPQYKYSVYYPSAWVARSLDEATGRETMFTAITSEFVQIRTFPYPTDKTFGAWFAENFPTENLATYTPFVNRFKVSGSISPDRTVAVFTDGSTIYVLNYDGGTRAEINYRMTFRVMVQSFKPANIVTPLDMLPGVSLTTTTISTP